MPRRRLILQSAATQPEVKQESSLKKQKTEVKKEIATVVASGSFGVSNLNFLDGDDAQPDIKKVVEAAAQAAIVVQDKQDKPSRGKHVRSKRSNVRERRKLSSNFFNYECFAKLCRFVV